MTGRSALVRAAARISIASPPTGWLMARMVVWKVALGLAKHLMPIGRLVRLVETEPARAVGDERRRRVEYAVPRLGRILGGGDCLERSLVTYRFLLAAGVRPRLVIGLHRSDGRVEGHAWVTVDAKPLFEAPEALERYVEVAEFSPGTTAP